jgi:hypothetical protein
VHGDRQLVHDSSQLERVGSVCSVSACHQLQLRYLSTYLPNPLVPTVGHDSVWFLLMHECFRSGGEAEEQYEINVLNKSDCMEEFRQALTHVVHDVLCMNTSCVHCTHYKHHALDAAMQELKCEARPD